MRTVDGMSTTLGLMERSLRGKKIESEPLKSGQTIRLARSGPHLQVLIQVTPLGIRHRNNNVASPKPSNSPVQPLHKGTEVEQQTNTQSATHTSPTQVHQPSQGSCTHERSPKSSLICIDCGEPVNVLQNVGPYKVLKKLGQRDTTFQAWKNKRTYILRTAPAQLFAIPGFREAFHAQLQLAETLNHGGIPRMIEVVESEGQSYLVYEMVYGLSLNDWVKERGVLSLPSAISWITEIARIVEYLHQKETPFIHQGINPNTIIRPTIPQGRNSLMLVNFGQFNHLIPRNSQADSDMAYRSPHVDSSELSKRLDLYALGATFLFMLTGADPYKFMKLGDRAYILEVDQSHNIPQSTLNVIGNLLQTQDAKPIPTITAAIDQFLHLI